GPAGPTFRSAPAGGDLQPLHPEHPDHLQYASVYTRGIPGMVRRTLRWQTVPAGGCRGNGRGWARERIRWDRAFPPEASLRNHGGDDDLLQSRVQTARSGD